MERTLLLALAILPATAVAGHADVTLFDDIRYGGSQQTFYGDVPDLRRSAIGSDRASSVQITPGCLVRLYRDIDYGGAFTELDRDEPDLRSSAVGNDSVSSMRISCRGSNSWDGASAPDRIHASVVLYQDIYYRGSRQELHGDVPDLRRTRFGDNQVSSVQVAPGCRARLYADFDYRGTYTETGGAEADLRGSRVGNDSVSSVELRCAGDRRPWNTASGADAPDWGQLPSWDTDRGDGVVLFEHDNFRGRSAVFYRDQPNLSSSPVGNYEASSIRVPTGCEAYLYSLPYFEGTAVRFSQSEHFLGDTRLGNDRAASIRVDCRGGSAGGGWGGDSWDWNEHGRYGVTLYVDRDFRGASETFDRDTSSLRRSSVGNDRATSVRVPRGCRVALYEHENYGGNYIVLHDDIYDLSHSPVGNDQVSSLRVDCH